MMDLNDFRRQIIELKKMGWARHLTVKSPGRVQMSPDTSGIDPDCRLNRIHAILDSMTYEERSYPVLMTVPQRCLRIADGAGVALSEVSRLYAQFQAMRDKMSRFELTGWPQV